MAPAHAAEAVTRGHRAHRRTWHLAALLVFAICLAVTAITVVAQAPPDAAAPARSTFDSAMIARGANLAAIGNCTGCHSRADGSPFAGGLPLQTPFGTVYSSNITPAVPQGIGAWSLDAFKRAMRDGVSRDGHHLYPAFPYDHFTRATDGDLDALYAFAMTRTPVDESPPPNEMHFPFGFRPLVAGWNLLFLDRRPFVPDPNHDATWNRGAYLTDALAHCSACHSPRNVLGAERRSEAFAGGEAEGWYVPPLDAASPSPQPWTVPALTTYLRTGIAPLHAIAGGPMQGVTAGLGRADEDDVQAIAAYVVSLMGPSSSTRTQRGADALARAGQPLAPATAAPTDDPQWALGASVYAGACARCHDAGRTLSSSGALQMPLAVALHDADPRSLLHIVRDGVVPPDGMRGRVMPAFGSSLTDEQLTALAAWLRHAAARAPPWPDLAKAVRESGDSAATAHATSTSTAKEPS
jgi:mono/diheme cytochrome c family protein